MEKGAAKLKQVIKQLLRKQMPSELTVTKSGSSLLKIEKHLSGSESRTDFSFLVRIENHNDCEIWWPIEYNSASGEHLQAEVDVKGRKLVNLQKQQALLEVAETWAKSLESQIVAKKIGNALL